MRLLNRLHLIFTLDRVARAINSGKYSDAEKLLKDAQSRFPTDPAIRIAQADVILFGDEIDLALIAYRETIKKIENCDYLDKKDVRFLKAYVNFRTLAIASRKGLSDFQNFPVLAREINSLPTKLMYKDLFRLPGN